MHKYINFDYTFWCGIPRFYTTINQSTLPSPTYHEESLYSSWRPQPP